MPDVYDTHPTLYKIVAAADVPEDAWARRNDWMGAFTKLDDPKYFSLNTGEQLRGKVDAESYAGKTDLVLLTFNVEKMVEEADMKVNFVDGEPRAFGDFIPFACLCAPPMALELKEDGKHKLPLFGAEAEAAAALAAANEVYSDAATSDDDGLAAFDQHTYDLDDDGNDALDPS